MKIGLNLLHAHPGIGGGWNYIKNLVGAIQSMDTDNDYVMYCTASSRNLVTEQKNTKIILVDINSSNRISRVLYENSFLQFRTKADKIDVMHWFANTRSVFSFIPSVVTIHDLLVFHKNNSYSIIKNIYAKTMISLSMRKANIIAPVSETTKKDIIDKFHIASNRIVVVPNIVHDSFKPIVSKVILDAFRFKYGVPDKFWLYVAHYYPHKNHKRLFEAYAILKLKQKETWPLVLCGMKNGADKIISESLKKLGIEKDVLWLPRLEDYEMPILYSSATALVFPSLFEGGGIPVMEALACGCPVVASNLPTTTEFAGIENIICFDGTKAENIASAMNEFKNSDLLFEYKKRGLRRSERFRKEAIIPCLLYAYKQANSRG